MSHVFICVWIYLKVMLLEHRAGMWLDVVDSPSFS